MSEQDQTSFLLLAPAEAIRWMHIYFVGNPDDLKELKRQELFERKCCSYKRKHLDQHFKHMVRLFYELGAGISFKQAFRSSIPEQ